MSMLAERKRKQKWSLNPRGKIWAQDTNKFGQKMLEKMGWTQGKGLGAKEDGIIDHIKVNYKNDSQGMGFKELDNQWTEHESNFTALLEALGGNKSNSDEIKLSSLEEKSQNSRARVHYKKFTRGKDLSRYSEKDLANIFGRKKLKDFVETDKEKSKAENDTGGKKVDDNGNFSNKGSMSDYFKKKLPNFGKINGYILGNNGVLKKDDDSESESELRPSFGFGFKSTTSRDSENENVSSNFISYIDENKNEDTLSKKSNKKKRKTEDIDTTPIKKKKIDNVAEAREDTPIKKKKKLKKGIEENGLSNPGFDPMYTPTKIERHYLETIEETFSESLNSTMAEITETLEVKVEIHNENTPEGNNEIGTIEIEDDNDTTLTESVKEPKQKKKRKAKDNNIDADIVSKKKKSKSNTEASPDNLVTIDLTDEKSIAGTVITSHKNPLKEKKKKKNKSKQDQVNGLENPVFNDDPEQVTPTLAANGEFEVKRKDKSKKKMKKEKEEIVIDNPALNINGGLEKRKKKKEKQIGIDNPALNLNDGLEQKKKKKEKRIGIDNPALNLNEGLEQKKKKKEKAIGIDNPALNLNDTNDDCDLMLNIVSTPVSQRSDNKSENSFSIKKVSGEHSASRRKSVRFSDVTRERIIPNKEDIQQASFEQGSEIVEVEGKLNDSAEIPVKKSKKRRKGLENNGFDYQANCIEENITSITNTLDCYEAEIENDMNEAKLKAVELSEIMVGEVGNPEGENEALDDGSVKLKFKYAKFRKQPGYMDALTGPKKSYKHLIKGDILINFKQSNLHEIGGYATKEE